METGASRGEFACSPEADVQNINKQQHTFFASMLCFSYVVSMPVKANSAHLCNPHERALPIATREATNNPIRRKRSKPNVFGPENDDISRIITHCMWTNYCIVHWYATDLLCEHIEECGLYDTSCPICQQKIIPAGVADFTWFSCRHGMHFTCYHKYNGRRLVCLYIYIYIYIYVNDCM